MLNALMSGYLVSLSLIMAIGAQNAFVLRQGLRREHVGAVVAVCALSDALLIAAGVSGFGVASRVAPWLGDAMLWAGVAFLVVYGAMRFRAAWQGGEALVPAADSAAPLGKVVATCLLLTWANPHVYLDTVVLLGALSAQYAPMGWAFGVGAALGSRLAMRVGAKLIKPLLVVTSTGMALRLMVLALQFGGAIAAQAASLSQLFASAGAEPQPTMSLLFTWAALSLAAWAGLPEQAAARTDWRKRLRMGATRARRSLTASTRVRTVSSLSAMRRCSPSGASGIDCSASLEMVSIGIAAPEAISSHGRLLNA